MNRPMKHDQSAWLNALKRLAMAAAMLLLANAPSQRPIAVVSAAQCIPSEDGCPLPDEPIESNLAPGEAHLWTLTTGSSAGDVQLTANLQPGARFYVYGPAGLIETYTADIPGEHTIEAQNAQPTTYSAFVDNPTGVNQVYALWGAWSGLTETATTPSLPATLPGSVLLSDNFDDPALGILPRSSANPSEVIRAYEAGEYRIQVVDPSYPFIPLVYPPGDYADTAMAVTARLLGDTTDRHIVLQCRGQTDSGSNYRLVVWPEDRSFALLRRDGGQSVNLVGWRPSEAIRRGSQPNRLELTCAGTTIAASINGVPVASVQDGAYASGSLSMGGAADGAATADTRFEDLVVSRADAAAPPPGISNPVPGSILLADSFDDPGQGYLPRASTQAAHHFMGYEGGEYVLKQIDPTWPYVPFAAPAGIYADTALAVDARVVGDGRDRLITLACRQDTGADTGYTLTVDVDQSRASLGRDDPGGRVTLVDWQTSSAIRPGGERNRLELICAGGTIQARVNGTTVLEAVEATYRQGALQIGLSTRGDLVGEVHFDNLVITQR